MNVQLDDISSAAEPLVIKLGMVMQHHGPKCRARRLVCCLQVRGHNGGSFNQIWLSTIFAELLIFLEPNLIRLRIIISWSVLCKNKIVVFKVKITVKVQNFIESLCVLYPLYHWSLGNQRRCADLIFLVTKPSTAKWAHTDCSTLTYTIARHITAGVRGGGIGRILPRKTKQTLFILLFVCVYGRGGGGPFSTVGLLFQLFFFFR